jgi:hypothetical protein
MKETGDMTQAVAQIIQERMEAAGGYIETASDRAARATTDLENAMTSLGETFAPLVGASDSLWTSIKIGAINALNTAVKPLIQALSEAGALGAGARATAGFGNLGGNSKVDRMIGRLGNGKSAGAYSIYTQQLGEFDKYINNKRFQIAAYGGDNSSVAQSAKQRLQTELDGALKMREEYVKRAQALHNQVPSPASPTSSSDSAKGKGGGGSSKSKGFDISSIALDPNKAMLAAVKGTGSIEDGYSVAWKLITEGAKESTSSVNDLVAAFEKLNKAQGVTAKSADKDSGNLADNWRNAGTAIGAVGAAMSQIEDPAAKVMGTIAQAIATIALTFASSLKGTFTPWDWIAAAAAGTATMISTIAAIHSSTGYAEGGMIKGNSYSGDNIGGLVDGSQLVGLNAGEVVLNAAQQSTLAQNLQNNGSTVNVVGRVVGEDIFLSADRYARRSGRGSILTGKNL